MTKLYLTMILLPLFSVAQDAVPLTFEVASVKPASQVLSADSEKPKPSRRSLRYGPQGIDASAYSLRALIVEAYQVDAYQGGASRILASNSRDNNLLDKTYDVIAKAERPVSKEQLRLMLRSLLADRFKLILHPESKQQPVYRLAVGKQGSKVQRSAVEVENPRWVREPAGLVFRDATLPRFCGLLSNYMDRPVLDATGIKGVYNFPDLEGASATDDGQSIIFSVIQKLGLQLVADKAPLEYLVVDHVERPSEN
jgi:uncharacterized protein (TIGR03435 family)